MEKENSEDDQPSPSQQPGAETEEEDEYIEEDDIPQILENLAGSYVKLMEEENYTDALKLLKRSEDILEAVTT
jgi:hypothetical protein